MRPSSATRAMRSGCARALAIRAMPSSELTVRARASQPLRDHRLIDFFDRREARDRLANAVTEHVHESILQCDLVELRFRLIGVDRIAQLGAHGEHLLDADAAA